MKLQSSLAGVCCVGRLPCGPKLCRSLCLLLRREGTMTSAHLQQVSFSSGFPLASIFTRDPCLQTSHHNRLSPPPSGGRNGPIINIQRAALPRPQTSRLADVRQVVLLYRCCKKETYSRLGRSPRLPLNGLPFVRLFKRLEATFSG